MSVGAERTEWAAVLGREAIAAGRPPQRGGGHVERALARRARLTARSAVPQACIRACKRDLSAETPVFPGNGEEQLLTENPRKYVTGHFRWDRFGRRDGSSWGGAGQKRAEEVVAAGEEGGLWLRGDGAESGPREGKRSYTMEHFRWGKPGGKKRRRRVKVNPNGAQQKSAQASPPQFKREQAAQRPELAEGAAARADQEDGVVV